MGQRPVELKIYMSKLVYFKFTRCKVNVTWLNIIIGSLGKSFVFIEYLFKYHFSRTLLMRLSTNRKLSLSTSFLMPLLKTLQMKVFSCCFDCCPTLNSIKHGDRFDYVKYKPLQEVSQRSLIKVRLLLAWNIFHFFSFFFPSRLYFIGNCCFNSWEINTFQRNKYFSEK